MNNNLRIFLGGAIGVAILTVLFFLLPRDGVLITAYVFALFAVAVMCISLWWATNRSGGEFVTSAAFPIATYGYVSLNIVVSVLVVALKHFDFYALSTGWFFFIHILIAGIFGWKILAMSAGREMIEERGAEVKARTSNWKNLGLEMTAISAAADAEIKSQVTAVKDAIRYADPMTSDELSDIENTITGKIAELKSAVAAHRNGEIPALCQGLLLDIKQRNELCKAYKN